MRAHPGEGTGRLPTGPSMASAQGTDASLLAISPPRKSLSTRSLSAVPTSPGCALRRPQPRPLRPAC
eukprot:4322186-Heterocapsa_arctica.AAC.1